MPSLSARLSCRPNIPVCPAIKWPARLGINPNVLGRWKREIEASQDHTFAGSSVPRNEDLARLRRELERVKKERDLLREAATLFARESSRGIRRFNIVAVRFQCASSPLDVSLFACVAKWSLRVGDAISQSSTS